MRSGMRLTAFALLATVLANPACRTVDDGALPEVYVHENLQRLKDSPEADAWRVVARVGEEEGGAVAFGRLVALAALHDSVAVVADAVNHRLTAVTPHGEVQWSRGQRGEGPGEMLAPMAVATLARDGGVSVVDGALWRSTTFELEGPELQTELMEPTSDFGAIPEFRFGGDRGWCHLDLSGFEEEIRAGLGARTAGLVRLGGAIACWDGAEARWVPVARVEGPEIHFSGGQVRSVPHSARTWWAFDGRGVLWIVDSHSALLRRVDSGGREHRWRLPYPSEPVPRPEREAWLQAADLPPGTADERRESVRAVRAGTELPTTKRAVLELAGHPDGGVWLRVPGDGRAEWHRLDSEASLLEVAFLPGELRSVHPLGEGFLAVEESPRGYDQVIWVARWPGAS